MNPAPLHISRRTGVSPVSATRHSRRGDCYAIRKNVTHIFNCHFDRREKSLNISSTKISHSAGNDIKEDYVTVS